MTELFQSLLRALRSKRVAKVKSSIIHESQNDKKFYGSHSVCSLGVMVTLASTTPKFTSKR